MSTLQERIQARIFPPLHPPGEDRRIQGFMTIAALLIFAATYVLISVPRIRFLSLDRPSAALIGGTLMVLLGIVPFGEALRDSINWETIVLLLGMMIVVAHL